VRFSLHGCDAVFQEWSLLPPGLVENIFSTYDDAILSLNEGVQDFKDDFLTPVGDSIMASFDADALDSMANAITSSIDGFALDGLLERAGDALRQSFDPNYLDAVRPRSLTPSSQRRQCRQQLPSGNQSTLNRAAAAAYRYSIRNQMHARSIPSSHACGTALPRFSPVASRLSQPLHLHHRSQRAAQLRVGRSGSFKLRAKSAVSPHPSP
jgi:hypothetical protein